MADAIIRLHRAARACRHDDQSTSRTARLLRSGHNQIAKKFAEEAFEVVVDAVHGDREAIINQSADLLYNLVVLWISVDLRPEVVWKEIDRRERRLGRTQKVLKKAPNRKRRFGD